MEPSVGKSPRSKRERKKSQRKVGRRLLWALSLLSLIFIAAIAYSLTKMDDTLDAITNDPYKLPNVPEKQAEIQQQKALSLVMIGIDSRKGSGGTSNTDVLIVTTLHPQTKQITMLSLPRDTRIQIPGQSGYNKINEVFAIGESERRRAEKRNEPVTENGMTLLKKTLEQMLGIPVSHYVMVDFKGFTASIDRLGGVEVEVDRNLLYTDPTDGTNINLKKGRQVLTGEQALGYVRHRLDKRGDAYNSSDYDRNRRQQEVLKAMAGKLATVEGMTKAYDLLDVMSEHVRTDLSKEQLKDLISQYHSVSPDKIVSLDNGAVWNSHILYTMIPSEKMTTVRTALQREMGITASGELNNAAIAELVTAEERRSIKPEKKKVASKPAAKPKEQAAPAKLPTADTTPPVEKHTEEAAPPTEIPTEQQQEIGVTVPPPDIPIMEPVEQPSPSESSDGQPTT